MASGSAVRMRTIPREVGCKLQALTVIAETQNTAEV